MTIENTLNEWERLDQEATSGPWVGPDPEDPHAANAVWTIADGMEGGGVAIAYDDYPRGGNHPAESMEFIAAARTALPASVAALRAVLNLHMRQRHFAGHPAFALGPDTCLHDGYHYPCPTVLAIAKELGVNGDD